MASYDRTHCVFTIDFRESITLSIDTIIVCTRDTVCKLFTHLRVRSGVVSSWQRCAADAQEASGVECLELPREIYGDCSGVVEGTRRGDQTRVRHLLAKRGMILYYVNIVDIILRF